MRTWAIANHKGGVGKTTTVVALARLLARRGERVLVVDLDPHGSLTTCLGHDTASVEHGVYRLFERAAGMDAARGLPLASLLLPGGVDGVWLLPACTALGTVERMSTGELRSRRVLARALAACAGRFGHVLVDCPPVTGILMRDALAAADSLLVPVQTEFLALRGLEGMLRTLRAVNRTRDAPLRPLIVPTLYDPRTRASRDSLDWLREHHESHLWHGVIPVDTRLREAGRAGRPLTVLDRAARGSAAYAALLGHLLDDDTAPGDPILPASRQPAAGAAGRA